MICPRAILIPAVFVSLVAGSLAAGRAVRGDVVTTTEGLVLEGPVERAADGSVTVKTEAGSVRLAAASVRSVEAGEGRRAGLSREAKALSASDADGWYRLRSEEHTSEL